MSAKKTDAPKPGEVSSDTKHAAVQTSRHDADVYYIDEATRRRVEGAKK